MDYNPAAQHAGNASIEDLAHLPAILNPHSTVFAEALHWAEAMANRVEDRLRLCSPTQVAMLRQWRRSTSP